MTDGLFAADAAAFRALNGAAGWPPLDALMVALSTVGMRGALFIAVAGVIGFRARGTVLMAAWRVVLAVVLASVLANNVIKPIVARPRPAVAQPGAHIVGWQPVGYSFPSGHAAECVAGACALAIMIPRRRLLLFTIAGLIALSRVFVGAHYPLDIVGGAILGWAVARFTAARVPPRQVRPVLPPSSRTLTA